MTTKRLIPLLLLPLLLLAALLVACANPGSGPDGGPYDETPPRIVRMTPSLGGTNEKASKVTIAFDELIKVEDIQEKVTISPPQVETPEIKASGKHISVQLLDSLKPGTTYTIDFSDAIVDSNEGNPLGNFTYYFSTGERLDTMEVAGHVLAASNLEPIKGILVGLHSNLADSAFLTQPFDRVARTDGNGHFCIKGVAPGTYRIYALKDVDGDFKYSRGEMIAFSSQTVTPSSFADVRHDTLWADTVHIDTVRTVPFTHYLPDDLCLLAFNESNPVRQLLKATREPEYFKLFFTAPSKEMPQVRGLNFNADDAFIVDRSVGNDTLTYWLRDTVLVNTDSLCIALTYEATNDSTYELYQQTDTLELVPQFSYAKRQKFKAEDDAKWQRELEKRHKRGDFTRETKTVKPLDVKMGSQGSINPDENIRLTLTEPPVRVDTSAVHLFLKKDSLFTEAPFRLERDSVSLLSYTIRAEWRPGQDYVLNVDSAGIEGVSGKVNKNIDSKIHVNDETTYGSLFLILSDADTSTVVQLLVSDDRVAKQVRVARGGRADFYYLAPGDYYLRAFTDRNGNGKWDVGSFTRNEQSEEVYYYPTKITVRANWDIEQNWTLKGRALTKQKPSDLVKQKGEKKKTPQNRNAERLRQKGK